MSRAPVYLHVGLKKTGTSYLQGLAWPARAELADHGLALVPGSRRQTHLLMREVRDRVDDDARALGAGALLGRLPAQLRRAVEQGATRMLITEESLSMASVDQVARLRDPLSDYEPHVVVTVRDLARQVPSAWQQAVKARGTIPFEEYLESVVTGTGRGARAFGLTQDVLGVLDRWAAALPPEHVHVVTVPPAGADPTLLARRFFGLLGVSVPAPVEEVRLNPSIGRVQAELLARVNALLPEESIGRLRYGGVAKRYFAQQVLAAQQGVPARLPRRYEEWCRATSEGTIAQLEERGYDIVGDLDDLRIPDDAGTDEAVAVDDAAMLAAAVQALAGLLTDLAEGDQSPASQGSA